MNKRITLELDKKLIDGQLLMYKDDKIIGVDIFTLLPEYPILLNRIVESEREIARLNGLVKELRGEDDEESN